MMNWSIKVLKASDKGEDFEFVRMFDKKKEIKTFPHKERLRLNHDLFDRAKAEEAGEEVLSSEQETPGDRQESEGVLKIENLRREAFEDGYREGERRGLEDGLKHIAEVLDKYAGYLVDIASFSEKMREEWERKIVDVALAVARKVIGKEISESREAVASIARNALLAAQGENVMEIRLSEGDYEALDESSFLTKLPAEYRDVIVIPDKGVSEGGCVIRTDFGEIDGRIEVQLREIEKVLREYVRKNRVERDESPREVM
jgi:flagellar assembly protein FliH